MKTILSEVLLRFFHPAFAATDHFSNNSGNDSRSLAEARNLSTPGKPFKLNFIFGNFEPGDQGLFKRG